MPLLEMLGYMAAGAVFATFWMRKMIPLRIIAIFGNLLFLSYGLLNDIHNVSLLHGFLLPLNTYRLYQAVELGKVVEPGSLIGEIGMFTPSRQRTQSILCEEDSVFLRISEDKVQQMYIDNPVFGIYLIKMIVVRLLENSTAEAPIKT